MKKSKILIFICICIIILGTFILSSCKEENKVDIGGQDNNEFQPKFPFDIEILNETLWDLDYQYIFNYFNVNDEPIYHVDDTWDNEPIYYLDEKGNRVESGVRWVKDDIYIIDENQQMWGKIDRTDAYWNYTIQHKSQIKDQFLIIGDINSANFIFNSFPTDFNFIENTIIVCLFTEYNEWDFEPQEYYLEDLSIGSTILNFNLIIDARKPDISKVYRKVQKYKVISINYRGLTGVSFKTRISSRSDFTK